MVMLEHIAQDIKVVGGLIQVMRGGLTGSYLILLSLTQNSIIIAGGGGGSGQVSTGGTKFMVQEVLVVV